MSLRELAILGCSSQQHTRSSNHSAYLFRWNEEGLLFDVGEGTQRQFIFANISPTSVNRIFISHFHGDHCLGLGAMILRLNLDKVPHPIHIYYPKSGQKYFERLRYSTIYKENIQIIEHPIDQEGLVDSGPNFKIYATFLDHGIDCIGWRIEEHDQRKLIKEKLEKFAIRGPKTRELIEKGVIEIEGKKIFLDEVSYIKKGDAIAIVIDTRPCPQAIEIAKEAKLLLIESTYLESEEKLAKGYLHMTAKEAAKIAKEANVDMMVMTHFSARYTNRAPFEQEARTIFSNAYAGEDLRRFVIPSKSQDYEQYGQNHP